MDLAPGNLADAVDLADLDPFAPEYRANPHPLYHRLRQLDPVRRIPGTRDWVVFRHADATTVLRDPRFSSNPAHLPPEARPLAGPRRIETKVLLFLDAPDHTRIRSLVSTAFTPHRVRRLRPRVEGLVGGLLDQAESKGSLEVIGDLAYPLPVAVICELLGVPADADQATFRRWASDASRRLDGEVDVEPAAWASRGAARRAPRARLNLPRPGERHGRFPARVLSCLGGALARLPHDLLRGRL